MHSGARDHPSRVSKEEVSKCLTRVQPSEEAAKIARILLSEPCPLNKYDDIAALIPDIQLPRPDIDLRKWAVIACDQFTSEADYWSEVEKIVGSSPSTLHLTLPEIYLDQPGEAARIQNIQSAMRTYLEKGVVLPRPGLIYVERSTAGRTRKGVVVCLDLDHYDFGKESTSLIRATEGTIVERLPSRMNIRQHATLEVPHILVLIDDPKQTVIESVRTSKSQLEKIYDFDLMLGSGHLTGYGMSHKFEDQVMAALSNLAKPEVFSHKYGIPTDEPVLLFAVGDGNHSLAAAKAVWEKMRPELGADHPARYALVEIENVHDDGLEFEPIHRVLFDVQKDILAELQSTFGANYHHVRVDTAEQMVGRVNLSDGHKHIAGLVAGGSRASFAVIEIDHPLSNLAVGTFQPFLDQFLSAGGAERIDYVHGQDVLIRLGIQPGNSGIYLPAIDKSELFRTVILDGALPRKAFSMGEAREKRFYMESRKISLDQ
jgi:uncharacterized protein (DUF1015 family)